MATSLVLLFGFLITPSTAFLFAPQIIVHAPVGYIRGTSKNVNSKTINIFYGIPYAESPTGSRRLQKPTAKATFTQTFDATDKSSAVACPSAFAQPITFSEDCLILNIYKPDKASPSNKKPVMIWIHGGGFTGGASILYDGSIISGNDVIVVTINYRLGELGFMSTSSGTLKGNFGLWDQHLAIKWVHDNIESFGGDVSDVTIFGESAGSSSVMYQSMYPGNKGLFHRVIAKSGSTTSPWAYKNVKTSSMHAHRFASHCGCNKTTDDAMVTCLRSLSTTSMVNCVTSYPDGFSNDDYAWTVTSDGDFVVTDQWRMFNTSDATRDALEFFRSLDLLMGVNKGDGLLYLYDWNLRFGRNLSTDPTLNKQQFRDIILPIYLKFGRNFGPVDPAFFDKVFTFYAADDSRAMVRNLVQFTTDIAFTAPSVEAMTSHVQQSTGRSYFYEFAYSPGKHVLPVIPSIDDGTLANHADELNFVFGAKELNGNPAESKLSKAMVTMWTNFAKSGDPNFPVSFRQEYDVNWLEYSADQQNYLQITSNMTSSSVKQALSGPAVALLLGG